MTLPTFIVIGASRSGTTSLHHYLGQHPEIHMSAVKSPNFFVAGDEQPPWEPPALRAELMDLFRDDTLRLQDLIGRDLSHWLASGSVATAR